MLRIQIKEISLKTPPGGRTLLSNVNFELSSNKIYTILGKNGSGKSTLIKALTNLLDNKIYSVNGDVFYNNENIYTCTKEKLAELRKNEIKYVFQDAINSFDPLKKLQYYFELLAKDKSRIDEILEYLLLPLSEDLFKMHPYEVSGGMAQRIRFALALLSQPAVIILDEPTSGIDSAIANLFLLKLKEYVKMNSNSVLLVTQDILFAEKVSDKIAYIAEGRLSDFSSPGNFLKKTDDALLGEFLTANNKLNNEKDN